MLLFLFSCTESGQTVDPLNPGEVRMSMNISTRATSDPEVLNANETRISRLRIYVFDGTSLDKMYYWQGLSAIDGTYTTPVFTVKTATGKTLYAIVNEPVDFDTRAILESVDHPNDLVDVQYQMADTYPQEPMWWNTLKTTVFPCMENWQEWTRRRERRRQSTCV